MYDAPPLPAPDGSNSQFYETGFSWDCSLFISPNPSLSAISSAKFLMSSMPASHTAGLTFPQKNGRLREVYIGLMAEAARVECDFDPIWFSFEQLFGNICLL